MMHSSNPTLNPNSSIGLGKVSGGLSSNSFLTNASNPYLIGDKYYSHVIQPGYVSTLEKTPPNKIIGIITTGPIATAVSTLGNMLDRR